MKELPNNQKFYLLICSLMESLIKKGGIVLDITGIIPRELNPFRI